MVTRPGQGCKVANELHTLGIHGWDRAELHMYPPRPTPAPTPMPLLMGHASASSKKEKEAHQNQKPPPPAGSLQRPLLAKVNMMLSGKEK